MRSSFFMKCLEVNKFSACEIRPSHWLWSFSWLIEGKKGGGGGEKKGRAGNQGKGPLWQPSEHEKAETKPIHQLHFGYFTTSNASLLILAFLAESTLQSRVSQTQVGREKPWGMCWPTPQSLGGFQRSDGAHLPKGWATSLTWKEMALEGEGGKGEAQGSCEVCILSWQGLSFCLSVTANKACDLPSWWVSGISPTPGPSVSETPLPTSRVLLPFAHL